MKKFLFCLCTLLLSSLALAEQDQNICRRWLFHETFKGYLYMSVTAPQTNQKNPILWMDTLIPYGIRPLGYEISEIDCSTEATRIRANSNTMSDVEFRFQKSSQEATQIGRLIYLDKQGHNVGQADLECSVAAIQKFCSHYSLKLLSHIND